MTQAFVYGLHWLCMCLLLIDFNHCITNPGSSTIIKHLLRITIDSNTNTHFKPSPTLLLHG